MAKLSDELKSRIMARLKAEPSDTVLSEAFGVSRKTVWRLRQIPKPTRKKTAKKATPKKRKPKRPSARAPKKEPEHVSSTPVANIPVDVRTKVDTVKVVLSTYFAVQLLKGEHYHHVTQAVLEEADAKGVYFRKLQVMDLTSVGGSSFVRFRSDLKDANTVMEGLQAERATISLNPIGDGTFRAVFPSGRQGNFPGSSMLLGPKMGYGRVYSGTKIKRWAEQFKA